MKRLFLICSLFICKSLSAQVAPTIEWEKSLGGSEKDIGYSIKQIDDGEFILAGFTRSVNGDVSGSHGGREFWIVKLSTSGDSIWQKCLGGSLDEEAYCIQQTTDAGFIVAGYSKSGDGDVMVNHGGQDYWIVKLDQSANIIWQKSFGGMNTDVARSVEQTTDGGFIVAGYSNSTDGDVTGGHGAFDYWIVKLDANGNLLWEKSLGGSDNDDAYSVHEGNDGGFIVAGSTLSANGDVSLNHGQEDYWILKLDVNGNLQWQKSFGGSNSDIGYSVAPTSDAGFIVAGKSYSNDGDAAGDDEGSYWIMKLDADGNITWQKLIFGIGDLGEIQCMADNSFIVCGLCGGAHGGNDFLLSRLDPNGNILWEESLGGSTYDGAHSVQQTYDGGFIVLGETNSDDGQVSGNHGARDYWVVKLLSDETGVASSPTNNISLSPNPTQSQLTLNLIICSLDLAIHVYDVHGKMIDLPISNFQSQTSTSIQFNTENLLPGFYILQIINNQTGESQAGKFVKAE